MNNSRIKIRKAVKTDSDKIWVLMRELAVFEKYIDVFSITPKVVKESGFHKTPPDFYCLIAEDMDKIIGMLVYYFIPYTAQNKPSIYMKELYVDEGYRGLKIGEKLMNELKNEAIINNCDQIKWTVASWNERGKKFYERMGAKENTEWLNYEWNLK